MNKSIFIGNLNLAWTDVPLNRIFDAIPVVATKMTKWSLLDSFIIKKL